MSVAIDVVQTPQGETLYINDHRIAGAKPTKNSEVVCSWHAKTADVLDAVQRVRIIRAADLHLKLAVSKPTARRLMKTVDFPKAIHISERAIGWFEHEVDDWLKSRPRHGQGADL